MESSNMAQEDDGRFDLILGGFIRVCESKAVYKGKAIMCRHGESGVCLYHTDPDELRRIGEFLIEQSKQEQL